MLPSSALFMAESLQLGQNENNNKFHLSVSLIGIKLVHDFYIPYQCCPLCLIIFKKCAVPKQRDKMGRLIRIFSSSRCDSAENMVALP